MKLYSLYSILLVCALAWSGCDTGESPSASNPEEPGGIAAKSPGKKGGVKIDKLKRPRSITLADGAILEKQVFVFFEEGFETQYGNEEGNLKNKKDKCKDCGKKCFGFWAKGARWKTTEPYVLDVDGSGLTPHFVASRLEGSLDAWDQEVTADIFGERNQASQVDGPDDDAPDGKNEVMFGEIADPGVIAVTIVWGVLKGSPDRRELTEWDLVFNANLTWGDAGATDETEPGDTSVVDLRNIATHEAGHAAGMDHSSEKCTEETMYPFAELGETKKRTLHAGDVQGIGVLYPE